MNDIVNALYDLKREIHDKAVYANNPGVKPYILLKVFDAVIQKHIDKIKEDI